MTYPASWTALVNLISVEVVSRLAAAGYPALCPSIDGVTPGKIQIGESFVNEQGSPPRVLFVPKGFDFANERSVATRMNGSTNVEGRAQAAQRAIARQWKTFEVQVWGLNFSDQVTPAPDAALDYDATQALSEIVWQACQFKAPGCWRTTRGEIDPKSPTLMKLGRIFVWDLGLDTPIADTALPFAPNGVTSAGTSKLQPNDGTIAPEIGCS